MRIERILELADHIEGLTTHRDYCDMDRHHRAESKVLDMGSWLMTACGTVACIGGWTIHLWGKKDADQGESDAGRLLGLERSRYIPLFYPDVGDRPWASITPAEAAATLRHLAKTGEVRWER